MVVTHTAAHYLNEIPDLDVISRVILRAISVLDDCGAWTWNLRHVAAFALVSLGTVRLVLQKKRGIDWYAWIHAVITAVGSFACLYLDVIASARLTGTTEPLRSVQCSGPLTSLHRILPAITMGYSLFDLYDGYLISFDFALHGGLTLAVMVYFCEVGASHILAPMLVMEGSTVFLNMIKADFFPDIVAILNQIFFVLSFFLCRIVLVPYIWANLMLVLRHNQTEDGFRRCFPSHFTYVSFFFGMFFNLLNFYWFVKIARKSRRRLLRIEQHTYKNSLEESHDKTE